MEPVSKVEDFLISRQIDNPDRHVDIHWSSTNDAEPGHAETCPSSCQTKLSMRESNSIFLVVLTVYSLDFALKKGVV